MITFSFEMVLSARINVSSKSVKYNVSILKLSYQVSI